MIGSLSSFADAHTAIARLTLALRLDLVDDGRGDLRERLHLPDNIAELLPVEIGVLARVEGADRDPRPPLTVDTRVDMLESRLPPQRVHDPAMQPHVLLDFRRVEGGLGHAQVRHRGPLPPGGPIALP